jgi:uncharacterized membrane protein
LLPKIIIIMLAFFETPAGFVLFKILKEGKVENFEVRFHAMILPMSFLDSSVMIILVGTRDVRTQFDRA